MKRKLIWLICKLDRFINGSNKIVGYSKIKQVKTVDEFKGLDWFERYKLFWESRLNKT